VQELMRHASSRVTLDVYSQARNPSKRQAQERIVQMIRFQQADNAVPAICYGEPQSDITWGDEIAQREAK
jgi:hypothetical protein